MRKNVDTVTRPRSDCLGTFPTGMLSPVVGAIKAGLDALGEGRSEAASAIPPAELRVALGYGDYEAQAKRFASEP